MSELDNLTAEVNDLKNQLESMQVNLAENQNAFFLCSMAIIIFRKAPLFSTLS